MRATQLLREIEDAGAAGDRDFGARAVRLQRRRVDVHHRAADELRDEEVRGVMVDVGRRADLLQHALVHDGDAVGERHRLDLVVRDVDGGLLVLEVQPLQLGAHLLAQLGVERADRLVHQHRLRPAHQRAADRDALHVAAGELRGPLLQEMLDLQRLGDGADLSVDLRAGSRCVARSGKAMLS